MAASRVFFPKVRDIAHMGVVTTTADSSVGTAVHLMERNNLSDVIFAREGGHAIFTVEDLMLFRRSQRSLDTPLSEVFVHALAYVDGSENVLNIMKRLEGAENRYFGVLDEKKALVGVVSSTDVIASIDPVLIMERKKLSDILSKRYIDVVDVAVGALTVGVGALDLGRHERSAQGRPHLLAPLVGGHRGLGLHRSRRCRDGRGARRRLIVRGRRLAASTEREKECEGEGRAAHRHHLSVARREGQRSENK